MIRDLSTHFSCTRSMISGKVQLFYFLWNFYSFDCSSRVTWTNSKGYLGKMEKISKRNFLRTATIYKTSCLKWLQIPLKKWDMKFHRA